MQRLLRETPQEAALLAVYFEEVAFHQAKEAAKQRDSSSSSSPRSNTGPGEFAIESVIGDDDEVDWSEGEEDIE